MGNNVGPIKRVAFAIEFYEPPGRLSPGTNQPGMDSTSVSRRLLWFFAKSIASGIISWLVGKVLTALSSGGFLSEVGKVMSAPIWAIAIGLFAGLIWSAWPEIINGLRALRPVGAAHPPVAAQAPTVIGSITRFAPLDWQNDLTSEDYRNLEIAVRTKESVYRFNAEVELTNTGSPSRARHWQFSAQRQSGQRVDLSLASDKWSRPISWPNVANWTFDQIQDQFIQREITYRVFVPLTVEGIIGPDLPNILSTFRVTFKDDSGAEIVCTRAY